MKIREGNYRVKKNIFRSNYLGGIINRASLSLISIIWKPKTKFHIGSWNDKLTPHFERLRKIIRKNVAFLYQTQSPSLDLIIPP